MTVIIIKTLFYVADTFNQFSLDNQFWGGGGEGWMQFILDV